MKIIEAMAYNDGTMWVKIGDGDTRVEAVYGPLLNDSDAMPVWHDAPPYWRTLTDAQTTLLDTFFSWVEEARNFEAVRWLGSLTGEEHYSVDVLAAFL